MGKQQWGFAIIFALAAAIILGYFYTPHDPGQVRLEIRLEPPSAQHPLGTDFFGRDIYSRLLVGGRISLFIGVGAVALGAMAGSALGLWAGFRGGLGDEVTMRFADGFYALPSLLLALLLATVWGPGIPVVLGAVAFGNAPIFLRLARNLTLQTKELSYLEAARALGASDWRLLVKHILPNIRGALLVQFSQSLAGAILAEASLSYLGVGIQPPAPSWGRMLKEAQPYAALAPWVVWAPGVLIALTVIGFNFLGDPRSKKVNSRFMQKLVNK